MQYLLSILIGALISIGAVLAQPVTGQTFGADLRVFTIPQGGTGTSTRPSYGQLLVGNSQSGYDLTATSSLGITSVDPFEIATTSDIAVPEIAYFTKTSGRTTLGSVATGTVSAGTGISLNSSVRSIIGGALQITNSSPLSGLIASYPFSFSNPTLTWLGLSTTTNSGMSEGNLYVGSGGIFQTSASSSIFGYTPLNPTRNLTVAGTANQVSVSGGTQDLSVDRTWTASLPSHVIFPSSFQATNATVTNATSSDFTIQDQTWLSTITSALVLTGSDGLVAEYAGATCTNQFVRSLSALGAATCATVSASDVSLAELTATNGTLTFSGTYNGSTARTIGLNLASANIWSALQQFANASSTLFSSRLAFFGGTATSTFDTLGQLGIASSSPYVSLGIATGTAMVKEFVPAATSTTQAVNWLNGAQQLVKIGTAGVTLTFSGYANGQTLRLLKCNPDSGTAGTITWPAIIRWAGGTAPTQTTTAAKCDVYSFIATQSTSTSVASTIIFGAQSANF